MSDLLIAGRALALDLASTFLFLALFAITGNLALSVGLGMALAAAQIGWEFYHRRKPDALQWVSLVVVLISGGASLLTHDPRFVMLKPTLIYALVGVSMLQRGWMIRYMPQDAMDHVGDMVVTFGYVWAGLMFVSAALNLVLALTVSVITWGAVMAVWGTASKVTLFFAQFGLMKFIGKRRYRAAHPPAILSQV